MGPQLEICEARILLKLLRMPVFISSGRKSMADKILKTTWLLAVVKPLRKAFGLPILPMATIRLVTHVPILEPITSGIAVSILSTPDATMATMLEVTVEELWIIAVAKRPINIAGNGLAVIRIISWA